MKISLFILASFFVSSCFSQDFLLYTYNGLAIDTNTCIFTINVVKIIPFDSVQNEARKPKVEQLLNYLRACKAGYQFSKDFDDKAISLLIPRYLSRVTYELGDQKFGIVLRDTTSADRCIVFSYDFDDSYQKYFLSNDNKGFKKMAVVQLNGNKIYRFINWDDSFAGTLFTSNHLDVSYFTKSKKYVTELEIAISKFHW